MQLNDEFTIPVAPDRAYALLLDLQHVAPCVPGGEIDSHRCRGCLPGPGDRQAGSDEVQLRGHAADRRARRRQREPPSSRVPARPRAARSEPSVRSVMEVTPDGDGSHVRMTTDLEIRGRAAQMGAGIIKGVSGRMVKQAAACLASSRQSPTTQTTRDRPRYRDRGRSRSRERRRPDPERRTQPRIGPSQRRPGITDPVPLRPGLQGALPRDRAHGRRDLRQLQPRDHPDAG